MQGVRGGEKTPGEFRRSQNWIGSRRQLPWPRQLRAPPAARVDERAGRAGKISAPRPPQRLPLLVRCGLAHAQFETIHPFLDGNGRVGRLLITLMLCEEQAPSRAHCFTCRCFSRRNRTEYYDRLTAIRTHGHWEAVAQVLSARRQPAPLAQQPPQQRKSSGCARPIAMPCSKAPRL
jgi:Fic family protein